MGKVMTNAFDGTGYMDDEIPRYYEPTKAELDYFCNPSPTRIYGFYVPGTPQEEYERDFEEWSNYWGE